MTSCQTTPEAEKELAFSAEEGSFITIEATCKEDSFSTTGPDDGFQIICPVKVKTYPEKTKTTLLLEGPKDNDALKDVMDLSRKDSKINLVVCKTVLKGNKKATSPGYVDHYIIGHALIGRWQLKVVSITKKN